MFKKTQVTQQIDLKAKTGQVRKFVKVKYLGSGGFARCYEVYEELNQKKSPYAVKIIKKSTLLQTKELIERLRTEIRLHKRFSTQQNNMSHIVRFIDSFQTQDYIYLLLELCPNQTLNELIRRRKFLSQNETRYFVWQLALGLKQLHDQNVVHRDVKLCNLFLSNGLRLKIGDFGLAAQIKQQKRRFTICGTANYVAPQMVKKDSQGKPIGHGYEVDVWALGVVCYTMFFGKYPFQAHDQEAIYDKVLKCKYSFSPYSMKEIKELNINGLGHFPSPELQSFIRQIFQTDPSKRLTLDEVLCHPFLTKTSIPEQLPEVAMKCMLKRQVSEKLFVENGKIKEIKTGQVSDRIILQQVRIKKTQSFEDLKQCRINQSKPVASSDGSKPADFSKLSNCDNDLPLDSCKQSLKPIKPTPNQHQTPNQPIIHSNKFISNRRLFFKFLRNRSNRQQQAALSYCRSQKPQVTPLLLQIVLEQPCMFLQGSQNNPTKNGLLIKVYTYPSTQIALQTPPEQKQLKNLNIQYSIIIHPRLTYLTKVFSRQQTTKSINQRVPLQLMAKQSQNKLTSKTLDSLTQINENQEKKQKKISNKLIVKIPLSLPSGNGRKYENGNQNKERNRLFEEQLNIVKLVYGYLRSIKKDRFHQGQQLKNPIETDLSHVNQHIQTRTTSLQEIAQTQSTSLA